MKDIEVVSDKLPKLLEDLGLQYHGTKGKRGRTGIFECPYCGGSFTALFTRVKNKNVQSCGCLQKVKVSKLKKTHGLSSSKLYEVWTALKQRVYNTENKNYIEYGAKGIIVYENWKNNFMSFYTWAMENGYKENIGLSLDRIDVNGNYEPNNCRWTTSMIQVRNRGINKLNTTGYKGVHFAKKLNKYQARITISYKRINLGYYLTAIEAGIAYNNYIIENNLEGFILNEISTQPQTKGEQ